MREYVFRCDVNDIAIGQFKVTVVARNYCSAVNKMFNLVNNVANFSVVSTRIINLASPAQAEKYKKLS